MKQLEPMNFFFFFSKSDSFQDKNSPSVLTSISNLVNTTAKDFIFLSNLFQLYNE